MHCFCNFNSINSNLSNRIELTPKDLQKSVGVISLLSAYQIFALTDSRGRLSLQGEIKLPYENLPLAKPFILYSVCVCYRIAEDAEGGGEEGEDDKECGYDAQRDKRRFR